MLWRAAAAANRPRGATAAAVTVGGDELDTVGQQDQGQGRPSHNQSHKDDDKRKLERVRESTTSGQLVAAGPPAQHRSRILLLLVVVVALTLTLFLLLLLSC